MFGSLFQFISTPNVYGPAMRIFTKISKVPFEYLRSQGTTQLYMYPIRIFKEIRISLALLTF